MKKTTRHSRAKTAFYWIRFKINEFFALDLRSLALSRMLCASVVLYDLMDRGMNLRDHYTDFGLYPRWLMSQFGTPHRLSLHAISGDIEVQYILFALTALCAMALFIGLRTRWVTCVLWFLVISTQNRNEMIGYSADVVLRLMLFWGMFLPWGAKYSLDNALNSSSKPMPTRVLSAASVGLVVQFCCLYVMAGMLKTGEKWLNGTATYYALSLEDITTPLGTFMRNYPEFLVYLTHAVVLFEKVGWMLFFVPVKTQFFRVIGILVFIMLQMGFGSMLYVDIFPWVTTALALSLTPTTVWLRLYRFLLVTQKNHIKVYYDSVDMRCRQMLAIIRTFFILPSIQIVPAQKTAAKSKSLLKNHAWMVLDDTGKEHYGPDGVKMLILSSPVLWPLRMVIRFKPLYLLGVIFYKAIDSIVYHTGQKSEWLFKPRPLHFRLSFPAQILAAGAIVIIVCWNWATYPGHTQILPVPIQKVTLMLGLDQNWAMFAPYPRNADGWFVIPGRLRNGNQVDVYHGMVPVKWDKPVRIADDFNTERWRKYMEWYAYGGKKFDVNRMEYGRYICREWNSRYPHDQQLMEYDIYFMREDELDNYVTSDPQKVHMWKHRCFE